MLPVDSRRIVDVLTDDMLPFERMIHYGIAGIMPAHVVYSEADSRPAGFSSYWLRQILRDQLQFQGAVFSDDLSMQAAHVVGDVLSRSKVALEAGCDMVLICNQPEALDHTLSGLSGYNNTASQVRFARFHGRKQMDYEELRRSDAWYRAIQSIMTLVDDSPFLELDL